MRKQEIELLNHIISLNAMEPNRNDDRALSQSIEAKERVINQAFEILQREHLGTVSHDFLKNPIVNSFIQSKGIDTLKQWYFIQLNELKTIEQEIKDIEKLISHFKFALSRRNVDVIKTMWAGSPVLRAWYSGQQVNFGYNQFQQPDMRTISLDELISNFKSALSSRCIDVVKSMWDGCPLLRAWYNGQQVNFGYNQLQQPDMRTISLDELINNFKSALASQKLFIIKAMWDENPLLRAWYSGQKVNFGYNQFQQPDIRTISLNELTSNFKSALASQKLFIINAMWDGSPLLRAWYSGQKVNFGYNQLQQPAMRAITQDELISNFKSALSGRSVDVIKAMWDGNNILHNAIRGLDFVQSKSLLKRVICSHKNVKSDFITDYVNWLNHSSTIRAVLDDIQKSCMHKKPSGCKTRQFDFLQDCLKKMQDGSQQASITSASDSLIPTNNSSQLTGPTLKKQKATFELESSHKKPKTEVTEAKLSYLEKNMLLQLNNTHFFVKQLAGLNLKKLSKSLKDELGIGSISKVRNETSYKVEISDPAKFLNNYADQLFVLAENTVLPDNAENNVDYLSQNQLTHPEQALQKNSYHLQKSVEMCADESFFLDCLGDDDASYRLPISPPTENTSSTATLQSNSTASHPQSSSLTLFGHQFKLNKTSSPHTNTKIPEKNLNSYDKEETSLSSEYSF